MNRGNVPDRPHVDSHRCHRDLGLQHPHCGSEETRYAVHELRVVYEGIAVAPTEVDQLVRRMPLLLRTPDGWVSAYGTEVLKVLTGADTYLIKTSEAGIQEVRVKGLPPVKTDTLGRKWISWVDTPQFSLTSATNSSCTDKTIR